MKSLLFLVSIFGLLYACVEVKPKVEFPCKVCQRFYNTSCTGLNPNDVNSCATPDQAMVKYYLGLPPNSNLPYPPIGKVCTMRVKCPFGSQIYRKIDKFGLNPMAWCYEDGIMAGVWNTGPNSVAAFQMGPWYDACRDEKWEPDYGSYRRGDEDEQ